VSLRWRRVVASGRSQVLTRPWHEVACRSCRPVLGRPHQACAGPLATFAATSTGAVTGAVGGDVLTSSPTRSPSRQAHAREPDELLEQRLLEVLVERSGAGGSRRWWYQYPATPVVSGSSLTVSQVWVAWPRSRSSGAPRPPILVGTHP
jgi:hypothetical protein